MSSKRISIFTLINKHAFFAGILLLLIITNGCNAPRNNPVDPNNPKSTSAFLSGVVQTISVPRTNLSDVVILYNGIAVAKTNSEGYFETYNIEQKDCWITFQKNGYLIDSLYIKWNNNKKKSIEVYLNQIPVLDSMHIYSIVINRYSLPPITEVAVDAKITDKDNDIDSVFIVCSSLGVKERLIYNVNDKLFKKEIYTYDLNLTDIEQLIGYSFNVIVKDIYGHLFTLGSGSIARVVKDVIQLYSPVNGDTVSSKPTLYWRTPLANYSFSQLVEIYSNDLQTSPVLVWQKSNLDEDTTTVTIDKTLSPGNYFWVVWCVDQFSNRSRSNPASFYVKY